MQFGKRIKAVLLSLSIGVTAVTTTVSTSVTAASAQENAVTNLLNAQQTTQLVVVISDNWEAPHARMLTFYRDQNRWQAGPLDTPVNVGRKGMAWGLGLHPQQPGPQKQEGDSKAPAGIFPLGDAFGYLADITTGMNYEQMQAGHYCMDVNGSPYYNKIVNADEVGAKAVEGSTEPMRLDIHKQKPIYKKGLVIEQNPQNIPGKGSCVFMHLWFDPQTATAGCTAMPESIMDTLLAWLDKNQHPLYIAMPQAQYQQFQQAWSLPLIK